MTRNIRTLVEKFAQPIAEEMGFIYVDTEYVKQGKNFLLTLVIDKPGGVQLNDCERLSRAVEAVLDEKDPIAGPYCLCVSSPGIDRPLKNSADFERCLGDSIDVKLYRAFEGKKDYTGVLVGYTDHSITIQTPSSDICFTLEETAKITLHINF